MNELDKMRQMAGIDIINEAMGSETSQIVSKIMQQAEAAAYDIGAEQGNVTSEMIMSEAKKILEQIEISIVQKLQGDMDYDDGAATEHEMGDDRNMEMGETNFKL